MEKDIMQRHNEKAGVAIIASDKIDHNTKKVTKQVRALLK
jgi:hypothetical protein